MREVCEAGDVSNLEKQTSDADGAGTEQRSSGARSATSRSALYMISALALTVTGLSMIAAVNREYAPEMYRPSYMELVADTLAGGDNYAVFDLNINIRKLRDEQWKRLPAAPELLVLGASQWQEASADLLPNRGYLNGHIHRDYYEDVLGMVELLVRHDKLPRDLVITIRDRMFTPVAKRTDYLWLPGIPYYQAMAKRLSLPQLTLAETQPLQRPRELISLAMLFNNTTRWHYATDWPYPTTSTRHPTLDLLHPDGSITWSGEHLALFTQARSRKVSLAHAEGNRNNPPLIDPKGVEAMDRILSYLALRGVRVHLAHPPFNPIYWERVKGSPYMKGLEEVEAVTRELAARHKLGLIGSFDPHVLGCHETHFIDAEHSNANCLRHLLADVARSVDLPAIPNVEQPSMPMAVREQRSRQILASSGWMAVERSAAQALQMTTTGGSKEHPVEVRTTDARSVATEPRPAAGLAPVVLPPLAVRPVDRVSVTKAPAALAAPRPVAAKPRRSSTVVRKPPAPARIATQKRRRPAAVESHLVWPGDASVRQQ